MFASYLIVTKYHTLIDENDYTIWEMTLYAYGIAQSAGWAYLSMSQAEPLGEAWTGLTSAEIGPSRTLSNAICIFSHDINFLQI